jgi:DNA-binding transcriptional LysR family regulator
MELRHVRCFLAVAEHLHFSRAAASLGLSQANLSEQVRRLEAELGFPLLTRTSRRVSLTPAGTAFQQGARRALANLDHAAATATDIAAGRLGQLRLGAVGSALTEVVPAILRALRRRAPELTATVAQLSNTAQLTALAHGELDAGFVRTPQPIPGLRYEPVVVEPFTAVLPADHRLATAKTVSLDQLADDTLVIWPRSDGPGFYDQITELCARHGWRPQAMLHASDTPSQITLVAAGLGVAIQPRSFNTLGHPDVTMVDLTPPAPQTTLDIAWRTPVDNPALQSLLDATRQLSSASPVRPKIT